MSMTNEELAERIANRLADNGCCDPAYMGRAPEREGHIGAIREHVLRELEAENAAATAGEVTYHVEVYDAYNGRWFAGAGHATQAVAAAMAERLPERTRIVEVTRRTVGEKGGAA